MNIASSRRPDSRLSRFKDSISDLVSIRTSGRGGLGCGGFAVLFMGVETAPRWIARKMPSTSGYAVLTRRRPGGLDRRAEGSNKGTPNGGKRKRPDARQILCKACELPA